MGFLRRLLGTPDDRDGTMEASPAGELDAGAPANEPTAEVSEQAYELALLRGEQDRLDELVQRQQRYADYAWQPPAQGGSRRADDEGGDRE